MNVNTPSRKSNSKGLPTQQLLSQILKSLGRQTLSKQVSKLLNRGNLQQVDSSALDLLPKPNRLHVVSLGTRGELRRDHISENKSTGIVLVYGDFL